MRFGAISQGPGQLAPGRHDLVRLSSFVEHFRNGQRPLNECIDPFRVWDRTVADSLAETVPVVILRVAAFVNCLGTAHFAGTSLVPGIRLTASNSRHLVLGIACRLPGHSMLWPQQAGRASM